MRAIGDIFGSLLPKITLNKDVRIFGKFRGVTQFKRVHMGVNGHNRENFWVLTPKITSKKDE